MPELQRKSRDRELPSTDPLNRRFDTEFFAMTDKVAVVLYEGEHSTHQLAAFDLETGKRLWEHPFHPKIQLPVFTPVRLVVAGNVMLTTWSTLNAFELLDGSERFQIDS